MPPQSSVQPLRIHKQYSDSGSNSSMEMDEPSLPVSSRALREVSASEQRRNSTNDNQPKTPRHDDIPSSSPFPSPYQASQNNSPRNFWQGKLQENVPQSNANSSRDSPSPTKGRKTSIENLMKVSRVKNNMFQASSPITTPSGARPMNSPSGSPTKSASNTPGRLAGSRLPLPATKQLQGSAGSSFDDILYGSPSQRSPTKSAISTHRDSKTQVGGISFHIHNMLSSPQKFSKQVTFDEEPQIQMFEAPTPDPSTTGNSYYTDSEAETETDDDDEDLHDTDKTPVIGPEDWAHVDLESTHDEDEDDNDDGGLSRSNSVNSRPLPPLPAFMREAEISPASRPLPVAPGESSPKRIPLEERLRMMMQEDSPAATPEKSSAATLYQHVNAPLSPTENLGIDLRRMDIQDHEESDEDVGDESFSPVTLQGQEVDSDDEEITPPSPMLLTRENSFSANKKEQLDVTTRTSTTNEHAANVLASEYQLPRISRESIRRQVQARRELPAEPISPATDSRDTSGIFVDANEDFVEADNKNRQSLDIASLAKIYSDEHDEELDTPAQRSARNSFVGVEAEDSSSEHSISDDEESKYSDDDDYEVPVSTKEESEDDEGPSTPTQASFMDNASLLPSSSEIHSKLPALDISDEKASAKEAHPESMMSLPDFSSMSADGGLGLGQYMSTEKPTPAPVVEAPSTSAVHEYFAANRPQTPEDQMIPDDMSSISEFDDSASVIHHQVYDSDDYEDDEGDYSQDEKPQRSPSPIPERSATIRSTSGMKLTTRKSATPADLQAMAAARRQVSGDDSVPPVPKLPTQSKEEEKESSGSETEGDESEAEEIKHEKDLPIALPELGMPSLDLNMSSLTDEFDRVIEAQKRGYLMRQNTKVIHASNRESDSETAAASRAAKTQSWSVEPWKATSNAPGRRKSLKSEAEKKKPTDSARRQHNNAMAQGKGMGLPIVEENEIQNATAVPVPEVDLSVESESNERGRLFVKVIGVKDLALPLPQTEPTYFCMTLDNGLHCVTTSWLELGKNAPIGQEFELVVLNDLEFQLTLQTKILEPPKPVLQAPIAAAVTTTPQSMSKAKGKSAFSNIFTSPKKRKEMEKQQQQLQQQQQRQQAQVASQARQVRQPQAAPTPWDLLHNVVARDGSFARSYISLKDFESKCYGRPNVVEVSCFNEWATEMSSVKSKRSVPIRKPPYKIGKLEVQLLFIPKTTGMTDADLPKSMNSAVRELKEAENAATQTYEGHLSQQGGDCPFWRRRYFKLEGTKFTAYHESTRQPRATINLSKASKLIDDRNSLTSSSGSQKRRKSGFSEDEEGYMFVEEGFRIRFANGECIDFYADSAEQKKGWMKVLNESIGRTSEKSGWCDVVLAKEKKERVDAAKIIPKPIPVTPRPQSTQLQPARPQSTAGNRFGHQHTQSVGQTTPTASRFSTPDAKPRPGQFTPRGGARPQSYHAGSQQR